MEVLITNSKKIYKVTKNIKFLFLFVVFISLIYNVSAFAEDNQKNVYFFWGKGCSHCEKVISSGVLEKASKLEKVNVYQFEIYNSQENREKYNKFANELEIDQHHRGIPFVVIECEKGYSYLIGERPIINNLERAVANCTPMKEISKGVSSENPNAQKITIWSIIIAALIDSINPCAFGVLIFLLATMFSMASSKRALKYGLVYVLTIFLVYFSAGIGIIRILSEFSGIMSYIVIFASALILIGGLLEIKDFFWYGKGISLKIPTRVKPLLEKISKKGTLGAVILLGAIVSLVELPCTGGIYLAILSIMHVNKTFGIPYLVLYNFIFVLPLIVIVLLTYYGTKTEKITKWIEKNKRWMRLAAGVTMIILSAYLLNSVYKWI